MNIEKFTYEAASELKTHWEDFKTWTFVNHCLKCNQPTKDMNPRVVQVAEKLVSTGEFKGLLPISLDAADWCFKFYIDMQFGNLDEAFNLASLNWEKLSEYFKEV